MAITLRGLRRALSWLTQKRVLKDEGRSFVVEKTDAAAIREGTLSEHCQLLVMPGGRDLPYCSKLNGHGNEKIREFVRNGGSYLGLCAGGYYGTSYVQFAERDPVLKVVGPRELKFFPGVARGPTFQGFQYDSNAGARACSINLQPAAKPLFNEVCCSEGIASLAVYYNGGCYFTPGEILEQDLEQSRGATTDLVSDVEVLATYDTFHCSVSQQGIPSRNGTDPIAHTDAPLPDSPAAIVSSQYGAGKVVLSGVHSEASPASLLEQYDGDEHIERVVGELEASDAARETLFHAIVGHLLC